jgi:hypothetical protein
MSTPEQRKKNAEYMRKWYAANPDKAKANQEKQLAKPGAKEAARIRAKEWYAANRERALARQNEIYHSTKVLKGRPQNEAHFAWKGDDVGYHALHLWVARKRGRPQECERCGTKAPRTYHWANISNEYKRDLDDWIRLCAPCHRRFDYENHGYQMPHGWKD